MPNGAVAECNRVSSRQLDPSQVLHPHMSSNDQLQCIVYVKISENSGKGDKFHFLYCSVWFRII